VRRGLGGCFLFHLEAVTRGLCARGHEATKKVVILYIYIYIYTHARVCGFAGTGTTFSYPREKTRRVENQTRTRTHGYKLTPKPTPYRVFTHEQASKMCLLPSLSASVASNETPPATMAAIVCSRRPMNLGASRPTSELSSAATMFGEGARVGRGNDREGEHTSEIHARGNCAHHQGFP
jgi:hypothetical protein